MATGRSLPACNVFRVLHGTGKRVGFHAFRRYRAAVRRKARVPEDLINLWLGHARTLNDRYARQLREDKKYRSDWGEWCALTGLGFSLVPLFHNIVVSIAAANVLQTQ